MPYALQPERENTYVPVPMRRRSDPKLLHEKYDAQFKQLVTALWSVKSDGEVEAPTGFFALVEIPEGSYEFKDMVDSVGLDEYYDDEGKPSGVAKAGWYVTQENEYGIIFVYEFKNKGAADVAYNELTSIYEGWLNGEES